jgi:hypothetical protein
MKKQFTNQDQALQDNRVGVVHAVHLLMAKEFAAAAQQWKKPHHQEAVLQEVVPPEDQAGAVLRQRKPKTHQAGTGLHRHAADHHVNNSKSIIYTNR